MLQTLVNNVSYQIRELVIDTCEQCILFDIKKKKKKKKKRLKVEPNSDIKKI